MTLDCKVSSIAMLAIVRLQLLPLRSIFSLAITAACLLIKKPLSSNKELRGLRCDAIVKKRLP